MSTLLVGALVFCVIFDFDGDGRRVLAEYRDGSSLFIGIEVKGDADLDGIPDYIEKDSAQWPAGLTPKRDEWRDLIVEAVIAVNNTSQQETAIQAVELASNHLKAFGVYVTYVLTVLPLNSSISSLDSNNLSWALEHARYADRPYVRQWFLVSAPTINGEPMGGYAAGHIPIVRVASAYDFCYGPDCPRRLINVGINITASVLVHEVGHTLTLCHGHAPGCYEKLPIAEQDAARASVMSYEGGRREAPTLTKTQAYQLRQGVACQGLDFQLRSSTEDRPIDGNWKSRILACAQPLSHQPDDGLFLVRGLNAALWPYAAALIGLALLGGLFGVEWRPRGPDNAK